MLDRHKQSTAEHSDSQESTLVRPQWPAYARGPVKESVQQIDDNTWLIGNFKLHRSRGRSLAATWYDDSDDSSYTVCEAPWPSPTTVTELKSPLFQKAHFTPDSAVWAIGQKAFCKVKLIKPIATSEAATLDFLQNHDLPFQVPQVLHHARSDDRSVLLLDRMTGERLNEAWENWTEPKRESYVRAVADACKFMASWKGSSMCGVDGRWLPEYHLCKRDDIRECSPSRLQKQCEEMGIDCSSFVFGHADLTPTNVLVDNGAIGIIDWECGGYYPPGWLRTKAWVSYGMLFDRKNIHYPPEWKERLSKALGDAGFPEHIEAWLGWL